MQVNVIAEREITQIVNLVSEIQEHLGLAGLNDVERREMGAGPHLTDIAREVDALDGAEGAPR